MRLRDRDGTDAVIRKEEYDGTDNVAHTSGMFSGS